MESFHAVKELDAVIDRGHMPVALERFPAADSGVSHVIQKTIDVSQIYIVILGCRYGAMANADVSFTHLEYLSALKHPKSVVVPFLLSDNEVHHGRSVLQKQLDGDKASLSKLAVGTPEYNRLKQEVLHLKAELAHDKKLWAFRKQVRKNRFCRQFSKKDTSELFDKHMVLAALLEAEQAAEEKRYPDGFGNLKRESSQRRLRPSPRTTFSSM